MKTSKPRGDAYLKERLLEPRSREYHIDNLAEVIPGGSTAIHSWNEIRMHIKALEFFNDRYRKVLEEIRDACWKLAFAGDAAVLKIAREALENGG